MSIFGKQQKLTNKMHGGHKLITTRLLMSEACRKSVTHWCRCRVVTLGIYHENTLRLKGVSILPNALISRYLGHNGPTYSKMG